jgi:hypothetical protein
MELNSKIESINQIHTHPELLASRKNQLRVLKKCVDENIESLLSAKDLRGQIPDTFFDQTRLHQALFEERVKVYFAAHQDSLRNDIKLLFTGEIDRTDWSKLSRFRDQEYFKNLLSLRA